MKKNFLAIIFAVVQISFCAAAEIFNREPVAVVTSGSGVFVSWRLLNSDPGNISFDLYRNNVCVSKDMLVTNYQDKGGGKTSQYYVITKHGGVPVDTTVTFTPWDNIYKNIPLQRPNRLSTCSYFPTEAAVGDLNGDGEFEIVVKWTPTNQKDNGDSGVTGPVYLDGYTFSGDFLWRINLGINIRAGSHYTQFLVYDFNNDGKAELICKTGPGSKDASGAYVSAAADDEQILAVRNTADHRNSKGHILTGEEFLTVFEGATGKAIHTIWYNPNRGFGLGGSGTYNSNWGDDYGNRGERYLACVAHLHGLENNASAVMCRGYYTRSYLWAVDFDGEKLSTRWLHGSVTEMKVELTDSLGNKTTSVHRTNTAGLKGSYTAYGQGNHNLSVADVDGDGCDEILYGSAAIDHDGSLLYSTGLYHGDAMHVGDLMPDRPGMEVFQVHEHEPFGWDVHDAATGELLIYKQGTNDNGAGVAADIYSKYRGHEFWSVEDNNVYDVNGEVVGTTRPLYRWRIYWDGDELDELLDGVKIEKDVTSRIMNFGDYNNSAQYGSKGYPVFMGDLLGDWREEIIFFNKEDSASLNLFSTTTASKLAVPCLMQDHTYRMGIAWQNTAYNMPPHLGYYLADEVMAQFPALEGAKQQTVHLGDSMQTTVCQMKNCTNATIYYVYLNGKKVSSFKVPAGFTFTADKTQRHFTLSGLPMEVGEYQFVVRSVGAFNGTTVTDTITVNVTEVPTVLRGDANNDGIIDVADITTIAAYILGNTPDIFNADNADANSDGNIDVADITSTAGIILN